jgi:sulfite reductase (ferredoxin)
MLSSSPPPDEELVGGFFYFGDLMDTKETKAQKVERLKRSLNPWECLEEVRRFAREGYGAIPPEWLGTYFRWWGVYPQGDGGGAVGGSGGEGKAVPFFMVRIRIPNGSLNSNQLRTIAELADKFSFGVADLTVRQNIQLHWVTIEALPEVLDGLERCGLSSLAACGDVTRNITGCPLAGVDADEVCDASPLVEQATRLLAGNPEFYNLPRKFKISITGCRAWCTYPEINDVGFTAVVRKRRTSLETGFSLRVGGGLSTMPHLAVHLNAFVGWDQVLPVIQGVAEIFRGADVLRESRERARLKFLFLEHGWTPEQFQEELEHRLGFRLDPAEPEAPPADIYRDHTGIHPQKHDAYCYVGAAVLRGRIEPRQMRAAADLADRFASGQLRTTNMQNLLIINVPKKNAGLLAEELNSAGLPVNASPFRRGAVACTGTEFCKLAITETKAFSRWLVEDLEDRLPGFDQHLKLHVTGCPNSCGQHWIADLGIEGKKQRVNGEMVDAYYFCVGGAVGKFASIARPIGYRCPASDVPAAIERLLRSYLDLRRGDESLRQFFARHADGELRTFLAGQELEAVSRDAAAGPPPHGAQG